MISSKLLAVVVLSSTLIASTNAACHQNCNGHGTCGAHDRCTCYHGWDYSGAEDCSQRVCPYGKAWAAIGTSVHTYAECSNQGTCNRELGTCECNEGFTGSSCQRSSCPSGCSGHGQCQTLETWNTYSGWDADKIMVCKCDPGYEMADCSRRMCPLGDDPLSTSQADEVHQLAFADAIAVGNQFALQFTDWTGFLHTTHVITVETTMANNQQLIEEALQALPNNVVPSVTVTSSGDIGGVGGGGSGSANFLVTFTASENSGPQVPLGIVSAELNVAGSQPYVGTVLLGAITVTVPVDGTEESKVCAGRGICNAELGLCQCHVGFYGHSCDKQTALQ